ncbi:MAG: AAA family ATPase [Paludibacteraceae bacterium]|nr:AAA family ATPase [Paludibacteraceae bacterium]
MTIEINKEMQLAKKLIETTNENIFLTGNAGTGKTTFLNLLRTQTAKRMVVLAPTGVAAINAKGQTIHSFFQLPFTPFLPEYKKEKGQIKKDKINIFRTIDLLVIDEISMVRADLLDAIDDRLREYRKQKYSPFGGVQCLFIGDLQQLPPVVRDEDWALMQKHYSTPFFFSSKALQESSYVTIELKKIYRQADEKFISILNEVRNNHLSMESLNELNKHYLPEYEPKEGEIFLTTHNKIADAFNEKKLNELEEESNIYNAIIKDRFPESMYPVDESLELKIGAQVMFTRNNREANYYNGKIGTIIDLSEHKITIKCKEDAFPIVAERETWENTEIKIDKESKDQYEEVVGSFSQFPLRLAWAITIHKSQGLTFDRAIIDAIASFSHGQVYVALSRCKSLDGMVLKSPIKLESIITDLNVTRYMQYEGERAANIEEALPQLQKRYMIVLLNEMFDFTDIHQIFGRVFNMAQTGNPLHNLMPKLCDLVSAEYKSLTSEIVDVANKFRNQYTALVDAASNIYTDEHLQQRIKAAVGYFLGKLADIDIDIYNEDIELDNRSVEDAYNAQTAEFVKLVRIKTALLTAFKEQPFTTTSFLEARAKATLDIEMGKLERTKADMTVAGVDPVLQHRLTIWRSDKADGGPLAYVMSMKTLQEIAARLPKSTEDMKTIPGLGTKRITKYGDEIVKIVRQFIADKRDDKLTDEEKELMTKASSKKTKSSKSSKSSEPDTYQKTLILFKEGKSIQEIVDERALSLGTIENHLTKLVYNCELKAEDVIDESQLNMIDKVLSKKTDISIHDLRKEIKERVSMPIVDIYYFWKSKEKNNAVANRLSTNERRNSAKTLFADNMPLTDIAVRLKEPPTVIADDIASFVEKGMIKEENVLKESEYKKLKKIFKSFPEDASFTQKEEAIPLSYSREKVKIARRKYQDETM